MDKKEEEFLDETELPVIPETLTGDLLEGEKEPEQPEEPEEPEEPETDG